VLSDFGSKLPLVEYTKTLFTPLILTYFHHTITFFVLSLTLLFSHHKINVSETLFPISLFFHQIKATPSLSSPTLLFSHQSDMTGVP
jgi:hypothetical protein